MSTLDSSPDSDSIWFWFRFGLSVRSLKIQTFLVEWLYLTDKSFNSLMTFKYFLSSQNVNLLHFKYIWTVIFDLLIKRNSL